MMDWIGGHQGVASNRELWWIMELEVPTRSRSKGVALGHIGRIGIVAVSAFRYFLGPSPPMSEGGRMIGPDRS